MNRASNRKSLVTSSKSALRKPSSSSRKGAILREPRVIARESFDKHTKGLYEAQQKMLAALHSEHVKQNVKPLYSAYFMKVTNRLQKIVRECIKSNSIHIAAHQDEELLFRLTLTHGQKDAMQTLQLFGFLEDRLAVFLDEARTIQLQSEQGINKLVAFANSASHAAEHSEADLSTRQQIALHQHFMVMLGQDLFDRVVYLKQHFAEARLVDAFVVKNLVLESLK